MAATRGKYRGERSGVADAAITVSEGVDVVVTFDITMERVTSERQILSLQCCSKDSLYVSKL